MSGSDADRALAAADACETGADDARANGIGACHTHACRPGCGACCIAPSISTPIPGMPRGKPAGVRCAQLTEDLRCANFGLASRPACCTGLRFSNEMCGENREHALRFLERLELLTR